MSLCIGQEASSKQQNVCLHVQYRCVYIHLHVYTYTWFAFWDCARKCLALKELSHGFPIRAPLYVILAAIFAITSSRMSLIVCCAVHMYVRVSDL